MRIKKITETRVHYGYRRVHAVLRREGWKDNNKRVYRLYCAQGLSLRHVKRPRRNKSARLRQSRQIADYPNQILGHGFCVRRIVRRSPTSAAHNHRFIHARVFGHPRWSESKGEYVTAALDRIKQERGTPEIMKTDNGSEFAGRVMDRWACNNVVKIDFSRPGKPTGDAKFESFTGRLRQECLNANWFMSLGDAKSKIEDWRVFYDQVRPHSAIEWMTPEEYALNRSNLMVQNE